VSHDAESGVLYTNGAFSLPDISFTCTPPAACATAWITESPTTVVPDSLPSSSTEHTVVPPPSIAQLASTIPPELPFTDVTRLPVSTDIDANELWNHTPSCARSKYNRVPAVDTPTLPFEYSRALNAVTHPTVLAATCSTNTKIPRFTLFKKLASFPETPPLWSASSAA
jgi:hypothetical protein